jgi:lytic murein transglycosylase
MHRTFTMLRLACLALAWLLAAAPSGAGAQSRQAAETQFRQWLETRVWPDASRQGVSRATFEAATGGIGLDWSLPDLVPPGTTPSPPQVNWQAEFSSPISYFAEDKIKPLESGGRGLIRQWATTLAQIEARYGVPKEIVVAIWGRESAFGRAAIPKPAIQTLATKAFMATRKDMFYAELIAALKIVQDGHIPVSEMKSSVAGALGQPQFLPSKYLAYAVDFDGDGRRDIWRSVPDTLASIANYLRQHGWQPGVHWGVEAAVPDAVPCALEGPDKRYPVSEWQRVGTTRIDGGPLPGAAGEPRHLLMPAGRLGPAFIVSGNFYVLKSYNESDLYALFIGHLADRLAADSRIRGKWGTSAGLKRGDVRAMQERMIGMGYDVGGADGLVGFRTRTAIGMWQERNGRAQTCWPDASLIQAIR